jgi:hypothetical protein
MTGGPQQRGRYGNADVTAAEGRAQMRQFLYMCRADMLERVTPEELCRRHRGVTVRIAEYELTIARQKRAGEA